MNEVMQADTKREEEKKTVALMVSIFCKKNHGVGDGLCADCEKLLSYAKDRTDHCPYMETKTFCSACKTHCYAPEMREKIREVMRFSGPRMMLYNPKLAVRHLITMAKEKSGYL